MSDTEKTEKTVRGKALRDFTDAETERRYSAGEEAEFSEGTFANFRAARLVEPIETAKPVVAGDDAGTKPGKAAR